MCLADTSSAGYWRHCQPTQGSPQQPKSLLVPSTWRWQGHSLFLLGDPAEVTTVNHGEKETAALPFYPDPGSKMVTSLSSFSLSSWLLSKPLTLVRTPSWPILWGETWYNFQSFSHFYLRNSLLVKELSGDRKLVMAKQIKVVALQK